MGRDRTPFPFSKILQFKNISSYIMERKAVSISRGQHLSDVYPTIERNTILCKKLTGLGATYSEITAKRNSIIVVPNLPAITGKCAVHKSDNLFGVMQKVTTDDVVKYLEDTLTKKKFIKLIVTPESFYKVKSAFAEVDMDIYVNCFMLLDECHKLIKDRDYRSDIVLPVEDFFKFDNKALVSATPILPSDPRFEESGFSLVEIVPDFDYVQNIQFIHTNNMLEAFRKILPLMEEQQNPKRSICFFINSTDMIFQLITKLGIAERCSVFCSDKSVVKLKGLGFKKAYTDWSDKHKAQLMFFTCRFYNALDIEMEEKPDVVFVSEPYFAEYTIVDPCTDVVQALGRFRNGISSATHIVSTKDTIPQRTREGITEFIKASEHAYTIINTLYNSSQSKEERNAFRIALEAMPYNNVLRYGEKDYFAIDNYIDDELVKSAYNNLTSLLALYEQSGYFRILTVNKAMFRFGEHERLSLFGTVKCTKELRKKIVEILDNIKEDMGTALFDSYVEELREKDSFIVDAYFSLGREIIEQNRYGVKAIRELMIVNEYNKSRNSDAFIKALKNSFEVGKKYLRSFVKSELIRLHTKFGVKHPKAITAETIKDYFNVIDTARIGNNKAIYIISPKI